MDIAEGLSALYDEVDYQTFYRDLFPEGALQKKDVRGDGRYNAIAVTLRPINGTPDKFYGKRTTISDELEQIDDLVQQDDFCFMSPISYIGNSRTHDNARQIYGLAIDLDGVTTLERFRFFIRQCEEGHTMLAGVWGLPRPTYLVSSGTGIHIYYIFEHPLALWDNVIKELNKLRKRLIWQAWTQGASELHDQVQYEGLFQGFRLVGSITKVGTRVRAFKVGKRVTVDYLNQFVPDGDEYRANLKDWHSKMSLADAKKKYPDWYHQRIELGIKPKSSGVSRQNIGLYYWWRNRLIKEVEEGHRYWGLFILVVMGVKVGLSYDVVKADAYSLVPILSDKGEKPFTINDANNALRGYKDRYCRLSNDFIEQHTGLRIERRRRNGRNQETHLMIARNTKKTLKDLGELKREGAPTKEELVKEWRKANPNGKKIDCERETGLSRHTVLKWWEV